MEEKVLYNNSKDRPSVDSADSEVIFIRNKTDTKSHRWRPNTFSDLISARKKKNVLHSVPSLQSVVDSISSSTSSKKLEKRNSISSLKIKNVFKKEWDTIINVVIVEARELPDPPNDGCSHTLTCKLRLGSESKSTKAVPSAHNPEWRERITLHLDKDYMLRLSLWDKGKSKNFMGSCTIDLFNLEKERTHEIWQVLEDGFGSIHLNITMCAIKNRLSSPDSITHNLEEVEQKFVFYNLKDWKLVGQLRVKVFGAKGFSGKPQAYCTLEIDNERIQTFSTKPDAEPQWNKSYIFNVYDITSTLDIKVRDSSITSNTLGIDTLGIISIPLLRIRNGAMRWYALKDRNARNTAKGNCPRILLEMTLIWNPVKAALKVFQPREVKYIKEPSKFDVALVYSNIRFIRDLFVFLQELNENIKIFLEWDNRELCSIVLAMWLIFWYNFELWAAPLLLLIPFIYNWIFQNNSDERKLMQSYRKTEEIKENKSFSKLDLISIKDQIQDIPEMTLIVTNGIEYLASLAEKFHNLATFKVPFLSYLTMVILTGASFVLYCIPINYLLMALGLYKFTRKYLDPERRPNNDVLDFISRIPDNDMLKNWKELNVPEPNLQRSTPTSTPILHRTQSNYI